MGRTWIVEQETLDKERDKLGWSLAQLGYASGIPASTICKSYMEGCSSKTIIPLAGALKIDPWYRILKKSQQDEFEKLDAPVGTNSCPLYMASRFSETVNDHFEKAFASDTRVLVVSIMGDRVINFVRDNLSANTKLDVLTWEPDSIEEIVGFGKNIPDSESEPDKVNQLKVSLERWGELSKERQNVNIYTYASSPTLLGTIVTGRWAIVELFPYLTPREIRPALLLRNSSVDEEKAFRFFSDRFHELFKSAALRQPGDTPRWEKKLAG